LLNALRKNYLLNVCFLLSKKRILNTICWLSRSFCELVEICLYCIIRTTNNVIWTFLQRKSSCLIKQTICVLFVLHNPIFNDRVITSISLSPSVYRRRLYFYRKLFIHFFVNFIFRLFYLFIFLSLNFLLFWLRVSYLR
jgi:hypothetical protein